MPVKILDAPTLQDDFYMNVLDWSINNNIVVSLNQKTYLWNYPTQRLQEIHTFKN
jgi:hypothetical protein